MENDTSNGCCLLDGDFVISVKKATTDFTWLLLHKITIRNVKKELRHEIKLNVNFVGAKCN